MRHEMIFADEGESTRITHRWELNLGVPRLQEGLAANRARHSVRENLGKLKELLERDGSHLRMAERSRSSVTYKTIAGRVP